MNIHTLHLHPEPFQLIKEKKKTIEMRLYDMKRRKIYVGDYVKFVNREDEECFYTIVEDLYVFDSFETLYKKFATEALGSTSYLEMDKYYSKEQQRQYGVVGIKVRLLEDIL